jgi:hypothetical protein
MLKKSVTFDENKNEIRYYEKEKEKIDYLTSIYKYMCISTETDDKLYESEYTILKSGKKIKKEL